MPKCELCQQLAQLGDILCWVCSRSFDPDSGRNRIAAESIDHGARNVAAAIWIRETYGPVFGAKRGEE